MHKENTPISLFINKLAIKLRLIPNYMYKIPDYKVKPPIGNIEHPEDEHPFSDVFASEKKVEEHLV